jgi:hypothetical protein
MNLPRMAMAHELDENPSKVSINAGISLSPDKSRYRTSAVLELQMSGNGVNQELGTFVKSGGPN